MTPIKIRELSGNVYSRGKLKEILSDKTCLDISFVERGWRQSTKPDIIHVVGVPVINPSFIARISKLKSTNPKLIFHWIGTDVLTPLASSTIRRTLAKISANKLPSLNLASAPWLVTELKSVGIDAKYVPIIGQLPGQVYPLPEQFTAVAYIPEKRYDFHNGAIIEKLSEDLPFVTFIVLGAEQSHYPSKNVFTYNWISDMMPIYKRCSVLLRLPSHDGLSMMVLEALSTGRHVIYKYEFPFCHNAALNYLQIKNTLLELYENIELNRAGATFMKNNFSCSRLGNYLEDMYEKVLNDDIEHISDYTYNT